MDYSKIILAFGTILGLYFLKKTNPIYLKLIFIGLAISFLLPYFKMQAITNIGYFGFGIFSLLYFIHSIVKKNILRIIISLFAFYTFVSMYMGFPFASHRKIMMIIPVISYCIILRKFKKHENEISILTILTSYVAF